jgi:hypothetical protein
VLLREIFYNFSGKLKCKNNRPVDYMCCRPWSQEVFIRPRSAMADIMDEYSGPFNTELATYGIFLRH